jgi:hypothetical protein
MQKHTHRYSFTANQSCRPNIQKNKQTNKQFIHNKNTHDTSQNSGIYSAFIGFVLTAGVLCVAPPRPPIRAFPLTKTAVLPPESAAQDRQRTLLSSRAAQTPTCGSLSSHYQRCTCAQNQRPHHFHSFHSGPSQYISLPRFHRGHNKCWAGRKASLRRRGQLAQGFRLEEWFARSDSCCAGQARAAKRLQLGSKLA